MLNEVALIEQQMSGGKRRLVMAPRKNAVSGFYSSNIQGQFEQPTSYSSLSDQHATLLDKQLELIATYVKITGGKMPPKKNIIQNSGILGNVRNLFDSMSMPNSIYQNFAPLAGMIIDGIIGQSRFGNLQNPVLVSSQQLSAVNSSLSGMAGSLSFGDMESQSMNNSFARFDQSAGLNTYGSQESMSFNQPSAGFYGLSARQSNSSGGSGSMVRIRPNDSALSSAADKIVKMVLNNIYEDPSLLNRSIPQNVSAKQSVMSAEKKPEIKQWSSVYDSNDYSAQSMWEAQEEEKEDPKFPMSALQRARNNLAKIDKEVTLLGLVKDAQLKKLRDEKAPKEQIEHTDRILTARINMAYAEFEKQQNVFQRLEDEKYGPQEEQKAVFKPGSLLDAIQEIVQSSSSSSSSSSAGPNIIDYGALQGHLPKAPPSQSQEYEKEWPSLTIVENKQKKPEENVPAAMYPADFLIRKHLADAPSSVARDIIQSQSQSQLPQTEQSVQATEKNVKNAADVSYLLSHNSQAVQQQNENLIGGNNSNFRPVVAFWNQIKNTALRESFAAPLIKPRDPNETISALSNRQPTKTLDGISSRSESKVDPDNAFNSSAHAFMAGAALSYGQPNDGTVVVQPPAERLAQMEEERKSLDPANQGIQRDISRSGVQSHVSQHEQNSELDQLANNTKRRALQVEGGMSDDFKSTFTRAQARQTPKVSKSFATANLNQSNRSFQTTSQKIGRSFGMFSVGSKRSSNQRYKEVDDDDGDVRYQ